MFPENIVQSAFQTIVTDHEERDIDGVTHYVLVKQYEAGMNVIGIIVFCIALGFVISWIGEPGRPLGEFFVSLDVVITTLVGVIMWYSPIGIASLIAQQILEIDDMVKTVKTLAMYMVTVILGLIIHLLITIPTIYFLSSRKNPYVFMKGLFQAMATALGTGSR